MESKDRKRLTTSFPHLAFLCAPTEEGAAAAEVERMKASEATKGEDHGSELADAAAYVGLMPGADPFPQSLVLHGPPPLPAHAHHLR